MTPGRWDYPLGLSSAEATQRRHMEALVDAWWAAFVSATPRIDDLFEGRSDWDLPDWMSQTLQSVQSELRWEFGPAMQTEGHRLVITPEARRDLRPLVRYILRQAPHLTGWEFYAHRLPSSVDAARDAFESRCDRSSTLSGVTVSLGEHHQVDLSFNGPDVDDNKDLAWQEAFVLAEALLGEDVLDTWVGEISVHSRQGRDLASEQPQARPEPVPLEVMRTAVEAQIAAVQWNLRDVIAASEEDDWTLLQLKPENQADYPRQQDLFIAKTPNLKLWHATRAGGFYDKRFHQSGETFCYLKLDGALDVDKEKFGSKSDIEDALDTLLKPAGYGCQIGGGTGRRYSYIELALRNLESALPAVRDLLASGNVPRRSWLLFHNCELENEWVGIYDDSPPPP